MLSLVVPAYNEEESVGPFYTEAKRVLTEMQEEFEIIFIDDGSTDNTLEKLKQLVKVDKRVKVFSFRRNHGKADALYFGFTKAEGNLIATLDADLQDKPSELPKFLAKHKEGVDLVVGWKKDRKDKSKIVVISKLFNYLNAKLYDLHLHDNDCGFKLYTKEAAKSLHLYGGLYRFIPVLLQEQGFVVDEIVVEHAARKFGKSKYGFSKIFTSLPDMFTMFFLVKYSKRPLHFFGVIGGVFEVIGALILGYFTLVHTLNHTPVGGRPLLYIGMLLIIAGFQILFTGFLADLMIHIAHTPRMFDSENLHIPLKFASETKHSRSQ